MVCFLLSEIIFLIGLIDLNSVNIFLLLRVELIKIVVHPVIHSLHIDPSSLLRGSPDIERNCRLICNLLKLDGLFRLHHLSLLLIKRLI